jgi:hypothetical protein
MTSFGENHRLQKTPSQESPRQHTTYGAVVEGRHTSVFRLIYQMAQQLMSPRGDLQWCTRVVGSWQMNVNVGPGSRTVITCTAVRARTSSVQVSTKATIEIANCNQHMLIMPAVVIISILQSYSYLYCLMKKIWDEYEREFGPICSPGRMSARPRPRPKPVPVAGSTSNASSSSSKVSVNQDEDAFFIRNRSRDTQRWKKLEQQERQRELGLMHPRFLRVGVSEARLQRLNFQAIIQAMKTMTDSSS